MRARTLCLILALTASAGAWAQEAAKPKVSKTAPGMGTGPSQDSPDRNLAPTQGTELPMPSDTGEAGEKGESMGVRIEGRAADEIPILIAPPSTVLPFKDVVGFARPGQTERVLTGFVEHLPVNEILNLAILNPRQAYPAVQMRLPAPPFLQMEVPPGLDMIGWTFLVKDQDDKTVHRKTGTQAPRDVVRWDGFEDGVLRVVCGTVYVPELQVQTLQGASQKIYGDAVRLDALEYTAGGRRHVEIRNDLLFSQGAPDLRLDAAPALRGILTLMRRSMGSPFRVTVYGGGDDEELTRERLSRLRYFLEDALVIDSSALSAATAPPGPRGDVTEIVMAVQP